MPDDDPEELLNLLLEAEGFDVTRIAAIPRAERNRSIPLSLIQQRLWFLDQLEPGNAAYNLPYAIRLRGTLNIDALERSLNEIVKRHEVLRTTFALAEGQPTQIIHPFSEISIPAIDLQTLTAAEREAKAVRMMSEDAQLPFNLAEGPLLRVHLLQLGPQETIFYMTIHHIVSDDWSMGIFLQELITLYETFARGESLPLNELPIQYADYAIWQRDWLQGENLNAQLAYWKKHLAGELPVLELPIDHPRPPMQTFHGDSLPFSFSDALLKKLNKLSQAEGATLFMTLLTAFNVLLHRYSDQEDILVGTPISSRSRPELEGLMGFFINTLVIRTDLSKNPSFRQLLKRVRHVVLEDYAHQDVPFEQLVKELHLERDLSRTPLFQVMFGLLNTPTANSRMRDLSVELLDAEKRATQFDLWIILWETNNGAVGRIEYNTDLFERTTVEKLIAHYIRVLEKIVADADAPISTISLLDDVERRHILEEWNATQQAYDLNQCLHTLFEKQVKQTPGAEAVIFGEDHLTYHALNQRANQLARFLQKHRVSADVTVGVCMERSIEMVIALLGILKAGGAYVPIDPDYPKERLAFMLEDSGVALFLTQSHILEQLPESGAQAIVLDAIWDDIAQEPTENQPVNVSPDHLAYMIYTSGSTGRPKGAMNLHRGIVNRLLWMQAEYHLTSHDRVLQKTPFSFDVSVWEFFWPLTTGACLVMAPPQVHKDSAALLALIQQQQISLMHFVPSMLRVFLEEPGLEKISSLRCVICSGEALLANDQMRFKTRLKAGLHNLYGPTEASIDVTYWDCEQSSATPIIPIGQPIANTQIYILDRLMSPVPVGAAGHLHIGGVGLGRGYHGRAALTAEKFVPNPFGWLPGERLYQTGDLARYRKDGSIEFLGRLDHQVKIRGNRIELGEIEASLRQYPGLKDVVVVAREDRPGEQRLIAYIVFEQPQSPSPGELRRFLGEKLPESMLPAAFIPLEAIPLMPNGKVDRRALPAPEMERLKLGSDFIAPRNPVEQILAEVWSQVLGMQSIGIFDNFFELGGDSILSIQVVTKARQAGVSLSTRQIFQHQTIAALATIAAAHSAADHEPGVATGSLPLTPIQHWFFEQQLEDAHHFNQALMLEMKLSLPPILISKAIAHLFEHHDALRMRFKKTDLAWEEYYAPVESEIPFTSIDLSDMPASLQKEKIEQIASETQQSLDLSLGPVGRVVFFVLGPSQPNRLLLVFHHLIIDGVSWRILLDDLQTACLQLERGATVQLPARTSSFKDWADQLQEYAQSEDVQSEKTYWLATERVKNVSLPVDFTETEKANIVASTQVVAESLSTEETRILLQDVSHVYNTQINDFLLAALSRTVTKWTGQNWLQVDMEGHGRDELTGNLDLSRTVGWFTAIYPVAITLENGQDSGAVLRSVKEQLRAFPKNGIGYGCLRYLHKPVNNAQSMHNLPPSKILFNYLGQLDGVLSESACFELAKESCGAERSARGMRPYLLDINAMIIAGCLKLNWGYSGAVWSEATIQNLAKSFMDEIRQLIVHCQSRKSITFTPSDFPMANLNEESLDKLSRLLDDDE